MLRARPVDLRDVRGRGRTLRWIAMAQTLVNLLATEQERDARTGLWQGFEIALPESGRYFFVESVAPFGAAEAIFLTELLTSRPLAALRWTRDLAAAF